MENVGLFSLNSSVLTSDGFKKSIILQHVQGFVFRSFPIDNHDYSALVPYKKLMLSEPRGFVHDFIFIIVRSYGIPSQHEVRF